MNKMCTVHTVPKSIIAPWSNTKHNVVFSVWQIIKRNVEELSKLEITSFAPVCVAYGIASS